MRRGVTDPGTQAAEPAIDARDTVVEMLARVEDDAASDTFYARLCEATCRLGGMDRAVIFRYDEARRRVRASGGFNIELEGFEGAHVTVESATIRRRGHGAARGMDISGVAAV